MYKNSRFIFDYKNIENKSHSTTLRVLCNFLAECNINPKVINNIRQKVKINKTDIDSFVPSDSDIIKTITYLKFKHYILIYYIALFSGLRVSEIMYFIKNKFKLRKSLQDNFIKYELKLYRRQKRAEFCYLPRSLDIQELKSNIKVSGLQSFIKAKKLIPLKYCRKWFYTKCVELGIPESVADFYQGRVSQSIGINHYLSKQKLADKFYSEKLLPYFAEFMLNRPAFNAKSTNPEEQKISL